MDSTFYDSSLFTYAILPVLIFLSRLIDVTIGTLRIIMVSKGQKSWAPILGFFEVLIWLIAISKIFQNLDNWLCYVTYAAGFATGNYIGLFLEEKLAVGILELATAVKVLVQNFRELLDVIALLMIAFGGLTAKIVGTGIVLNNLFKRFKDFFGEENEIKLTLPDGRDIAKTFIPLKKELEVNVGIKIDFSQADQYIVHGRGEMHIAILLENMRREGYEVQVSQPRVILKKKGEKTLEPFEELIIDVPESMSGGIIEKIAKRKGTMLEMKTHNDNARLVFEIPTRGLLGLRSEFIIDTRGEGIMASRVIGFRPHVGEIKRRQVGSMVSMATGKSLGYALYNLQDRGALYIGPTVEIYEGMVVGNDDIGLVKFLKHLVGHQFSAGIIAIRVIGLQNT